MNKKILISNKEMEITVLEEKGAEITEKLEMSFEDAKDLIFENNNKVGHIEIRSEKPFDTSELALAMMFENWAYFPSGMGMASSRIGTEFTAEGKFTLRMPERTVIFRKELDDPYGKKRVEMLNRYSRYLNAVFTGKNELEIVLENGKISYICINDKETAEDVKEWKEKMETADTFYVSIMHDYLGFSVNKPKKEVSLHIEAISGTILEFRGGKWKADDDGYEGNEYYEFFFRVRHLLDIFKNDQEEIIMNVLQFIGLVLFTAGLVNLIGKTHFGKKGNKAEFAACLISGIILCSANAGLNLKIAVSLSLLAASVIGAPFIQFKKKGER